MKKFIYVALAAIFAAVPAFATDKAPQELFDSKFSFVEFAPKNLVDLYKAAVIQAGPSESIEMSLAGLSTEIYRAAVAPGAQLINQSVRGPVGAGHEVLITGFVYTPAAGISGDSASRLSARTLIRAVGPGIAQFGVTNTMSDPKITVYGSDGQTWSNDDWGSDAGALNVMFNLVGAFALAPGSKDAALVADFKPNVSYTAIVSAASGGGRIALVEIYDVNRNTQLIRLGNLSVRAHVNANESLTAGFVIDGKGPKSVLSRGVGPGLASFGVSGFMTDPMITAYNNKGAVLTSNNDWSPGVSTLIASAGAFPFQQGSKDAAFTLRLMADGPVSTTIQLASQTAGQGGTVLIETYDLGEASVP